MGYQNLIFLNHHLRKSDQIHSVEKLHEKELDSPSILLKDAVPALKKNFWQVLSGFIF